MNSSDPTKIWQNWAENLSATPTQRHAPKTLEELIAVVKSASAHGHRMRAVGNGHSWSPLVPTEGVMISMQNFNAIHLADDRRTVTMQAGVTVDAFAQFLLANDVCQPSGVGIGLGEAQYGGIVSTGCHGSGIEQQSVSDWVVGLEIVTAGGVLRSYSLAKDGRQVMDVLCLSLGLCGVIHTITTKVEPMFRVHVVESKEPLAATLAGLEALVMKNDYAEVSWMPFNDGVWVQKANRTDAPITRDGFAPPNNPFMDLVYRAGSAMALSVIENDPSMTPSLLKASFLALDPGDYVTKVTHYIHCADYRFFLDAYKISDIEVIFEIDERFDSVRKAFAIASAKIDQWATAGRYPINVTLGFRFIKDSDATLSPARGNRYTCMVEVFSYHRTDLFETFAGELATAWMTELPRARPHFAKGFQFMKKAIPLMREAFGEQLRSFLAVRAALGVDPDNLFSNAILDELFSIHRAP